MSRSRAWSGTGHIHADLALIRLILYSCHRAAAAVLNAAILSARDVVADRRKSFGSLAKRPNIAIQTNERTTSTSASATLSLSTLLQPRKCR